MREFFTPPRVTYHGWFTAYSLRDRSESADFLPMSAPAKTPRGFDVRNQHPLAARADAATQSTDQEQLALCGEENLNRVNQPLKYGFADRSSARKGLEVAAGVAIADRLGSIRQTAGKPIGRHAYMAIVWLGSRWLQLEQPGVTAIPFTQYRLLHDFGWESSGKNARDALKRTLLNLQGARWEGEVNDSATGRKTHEDHFGIIDRILWPVVQRGQVERAGYISLGNWFLEQLRNEAGVYVDWQVLRELPPIARKLYGLLENDRFELDGLGAERQAYVIDQRLFASVGSTCARERDNVAAVMRACEALQAHSGVSYGFVRERVALDGRWRQQLVVSRKQRHGPSLRLGRRA